MPLAPNICCSCNKITNTWNQILHENWNVFFSNISHPMTVCIRKPQTIFQPARQFFSSVIWKTPKTAWRETKNCDNIIGLFFSESMVHFSHCPINAPKTLLKRDFEIVFQTGPHRLRARKFKKAYDRMQHIFWGIEIIPTFFEDIRTLGKPGVFP